MEKPSVLLNIINNMVMEKKGVLLTGLFILLSAIAGGCAHYTCAPLKGYHEPWVQTGDSYGTGEACMTAIWDVGVCATDTQAVADIQIKWALDCMAYCKTPSKKKGIKSCYGVSKNQDHGRPLCKRIKASADMPPLDTPWYVICSDLASTCECRPKKSKKH